MSWRSRKKKEDIFCTVYFFWRKFFNIYVLSQCIVYWIHFQSVHTFTYWKNNTSYTFLLVFKIVENLQCTLKNTFLIEHLWVTASASQNMFKLTSIFSSLTILLTDSLSISNFSFVWYNFFFNVVIWV